MNILGGPDQPRNRENHDADDDNDSESDDESSNLHDEDLNEIEVRETETYLRDKLEAVSGCLKDADNKMLHSLERSDRLNERCETYSVAKSLVTDIKELKITVNQDSEDNSEINESVQSERNKANSNQIDNENICCKLEGEFPEESEDKEEEFEDENIDELVNISESNREFRPFRNEESLTHVNTHLQRTRNSDSVSRASTQSTIDPRVIREKVKKQQKKKQEVLKARRIRKSGEAALQTKLRRDTSQDIKHSYDWF